MSKTKWQKIENKRDQINAVIRSLLKNNIEVKGQTIYIGQKPVGGKWKNIESIVGIKTYAKLDFLRRNHMYTIIDKRNENFNCQYPGTYIL